METERDTSEPRTSTCPVTSTPAIATASPRHKRVLPILWVMPWMLQREKRECPEASWPT